MDSVMAVLFDPETGEKLDQLASETWASLSPERRELTTMSRLRGRLIRRAAQEGLHDPARLRAYAILQVVPKS